MQVALSWLAVTSTSPVSPGAPQFGAKFPLQGRQLLDAASHPWVGGQDAQVASLVASPGRHVFGAAHVMSAHVLAPRQDERPGSHTYPGWHASKQCGCGRSS